LSGRGPHIHQFRGPSSFSRVYFTLGQVEG
jgi:hypothetical protein